MSQRSTRAEALAVLARLRSRHLVRRKFSHIQQLYDVERRFPSTIATASLKTIEAEIDAVAEATQATLNDLNVESFRAFVNRPEIVAASFGGQPTVRRILRGNGREEDFVNLTKFLENLHQNLSAGDRERP